MRRFKNFTIGGIQSKVFNLILYTILLLTAAFMALSIYQNNTLTQLAAESAQRQQESIGDITGRVMDAVVDQNLERANRTDAAIVDALFADEARRVMFLADYAAKLFAHPEEYAPKPYHGPRAEDDGTWAAKVIYAPGVDPEDPAVKEKLGLVANLSEIMVSLCSSYEAASLYGDVEGGIRWVSTLAVNAKELCPEIAVIFVTDDEAIPLRHLNCTQRAIF